MTADWRTKRRPVRAAVAIAGAGSLGTFLAGAVRELLIAIRHHNVALADPEAQADDPRLMRPGWGHVTIDAIGGSSAGAITGAQLVKGLFEPHYVGEGKSIDAIGTMTGDWIRGGDFKQLSPVGNQPTESGPIEAPGWTLMSGAYLYDLVRRLLEPSSGRPSGVPGNPLDPGGIVGMGITLTDLLGFHEPADFHLDHVLGHLDFGRPEPSMSRIVSHSGMEIRDLGGRGHGEVRKVFVAKDGDAYAYVREFLRISNRRGRARGVEWSSHAAVRLAALCAASAALPLAVGPVALTDRAAELEAEHRRLYLDGGTLNNKPVAPALKLGRWHDSVRIIKAQEEDGTIPIEAIERELVYDRVCFFFDAFPDRARDEWRSPHPDEAFRGDYALALTEEAVKARNDRIDAAIERPSTAMGVLFESIMSSLRAQDIRNIAKTNFMLRERDKFIIERCASPPKGRVVFKIDTVDKAQAYASVVRMSCSNKLSAAQRLAVAERIWETDRWSGLSGRRTIAMIPVFSPKNYQAVLAGEAMYAVGGLLSESARKHDAEVGSRVGRAVLDSLRDEATARVNLPEAPHSVIPNDTAPLISRLRVAVSALIDANFPASKTLRFFAKLPIQAEPLIRMFKSRLDESVKGLPPEEEDD